ncbi:tumor necrosis factor receptor superfamily member 10C [Hoplias malabaricus]|uniref:tumor necrosis factor receptor superfamily member 10C n=1 Tax=Hoplias malabaricus TaxID=27720 RepID=UPI003462A13E
MSHQTYLLLLGLSWGFVLISVTAGITCKPGEMATIKRDRCIKCPNQQYRPQPGDYVECLNCNSCGGYSKEVSPCTSVQDTKCECFEGFIIVYDECTCIKGSGIKTSGNGVIKCEKCEDGTFTNQDNSECKRWKTCGGGTGKGGSKVSDVICENVVTQPPSAINLLQINTSTAAPPKTQTPSSRAPTKAQTPFNRPLTTKHSSSAGTTSGSVTPSSKQHGLWLVPLGCVLAFLLIQFLIIKLKVTPCFHKNKKNIIRGDSACKKPVEESGEKFITCVVNSVNEPDNYSEKSVPNSP